MSAYDHDECDAMAGEIPVALAALAVGANHSDGGNVAEERSVVLGASASGTTQSEGETVAEVRSVVSGALAPETKQHDGVAGVVSQTGAAGENTHGEESPNCIEGVWNESGHAFITRETVSVLYSDGEKMERYPSEDMDDFKCWVRGRNQSVEECVQFEKSCRHGMKCRNKFYLEKLPTGMVAVYPAQTVTCFRNHMCLINVRDNASHCCIQDMAACVKEIQYSYNKDANPTDRCGNPECPLIHCAGWAEHIRSLAVLEAVVVAQGEAVVVAQSLASIPEEHDIEAQNIEEVGRALATLLLTAERSPWLLEQDAEADRRKAARDEREAQNQLKAKVADAQAAKVEVAAQSKANIAATRAAWVKQRELSAEAKARNERELLTTAAAAEERERLAREVQIRLCQADRDARLARIQQAHVAQVAREQHVQAALAEQAQAMRAQAEQAQAMRVQAMRFQAVQAQAQVEQVQAQAEFVVPGPRVNEVFYKLPGGQIVYYTLLADGKPVLVLV